MARRWITHGMVAACLPLALVPSVAIARDRALQAACFAPETLTAINGEGAVAKGDRRFDAGAVPRTLIPAQPIQANLRGAIRRVDLPKGEKLIALTFDLCEQRGEVAGYSGEIFDTLRRENVAATVFAGGKWMRSHQARSEQLMTDPLFEFANHSDTHRNLRKLEGATLHEEILAPQRVYEGYRERLATTQCAARAPSGLQSVAPRLGLFRFPFGACNATALNAVNDAGLVAIQWDVSTGDPDPHQSADAIVNALVRRVRPGSIIVAHANGRGWNTAAALPRAIPKLKAMGYTFVTVSELLARGTPVIAETCYDSRPGDTDRYDFQGAINSAAKLPFAPAITTGTVAPATPAKRPQSPVKKRTPDKDAGPLPGETN